MAIEEKKGALDKRVQGYMNKANGAQFERLISLGCNYYRNMGMADIEKTPEPMHVIKRVGNGRFIANYISKAQPDYKGILKGGRAICFEAKYTSTGKIAQDRVTEEQTTCLTRAEILGAVAFVLISFGQGYYYRVPWDVWLNMGQLLHHKYITVIDAEKNNHVIANLCINNGLMFLRDVIY